MGLLSVPVSSLPAGFSSAPYGRSVGSKKGTPGTLPCRSPGPQPPHLLPSVFLGFDAAGILVAERGLERGGLLYLDQKQSLTHIFDSLFYLSMHLKCGYVIVCVSGVQFSPQFLLQTLLHGGSACFIILDGELPFSEGILYACLHRKFMSD